MELVLSLVLRAKAATDPDSLWTDMTAVRQVVRARRRLSKDDHGGFALRIRKKQSMASGLSAGDLDSAGNTTLTFTIDEPVFARGDTPNHRKLPPTGLVHAQLEMPGREQDLVGTIVGLSRGNNSTEPSLPSDDQPSLTRSSTSEPSSEASAIEMRLGEFLGRGRTWDVFAATLAARLPAGDVFHAPAVVKHVELTSLESVKEAHAGYPALGRVLRAMDREAFVLHALHRAVPGIAPQPYALWTAAADDHVLFATEDCGDMIAPSAAAVDEATRRAVADAYARVHAAGFVHGDVHWRHVMRDRGGGVRLVDWEGARDVRGDPDGGRAAIEEEIATVNDMLGFDTSP